MKKMTIATLAILASMTSAVAFANGETAAPKTCTAAFTDTGTAEGGGSGGAPQPEDNEDGSAETTVPVPGGT